MINIVRLTPEEVRLIRGSPTPRTKTPTPSSFAQWEFKAPAKHEDRFIIGTYIGTVTIEGQRYTLRLVKERTRGTGNSYSMTVSTDTVLEGIPDVLAQQNLRALYEKLEKEHSTLKRELIHNLPRR